MPDPCNNCGACCYYVRGVTDIWKEKGWLLPGNMCKFYNTSTKRCSIYERRPEICRMECTAKMRGLSLEEWYEQMEKHCDTAHEVVFACKREARDPVTGIRPQCNHQHEILELQLETSVACNARCHFCPYMSPANDARRGKFMDMDLFRKIVDEAATIRQIRQFVINGLGEPLVDPRIVERIRYIREKCPDVHIMLHTNGVYANDPKALADAGLNNLIFSLNAVTPEQHERVMGLHDQFEHVCRNIEKALKVPLLKVNVHAVFSMDKFTTADVVAFNKRWGDNALCVTEKNWLGHNRSLSRWPYENEGCFRALSQIYITYNGDVHMCCLDAFGKIVFGNVREKTIREVYNGDKYVQFRLAHAENRALDVPECTGCTRC